MSEPIPRRDAEDVLSSVRRLIAEDDARAADVDQARAPAKGVTMERLVLTPSLLVAHDSPRDAAPASSLSDNIAELEAGIARRAEGEEPEDSSAYGHSDRPADSEDPADTAEGAAWTADPGTAEGSDTSTQDTAEILASLDSAEEREAAARLLDALAEDDESENAPRCDAESDADPIAGEDDTRSGPPETDPVPSHAEEIEHGPAKTVTDDDSAKVLQLGPQLRSDSRPHDAAQPQDMKKSDERETGSPAGAEPDANARDADVLASTGEDALIDEDALRDLIAEIVREELQGRLGERISRNVRKLVRREIHRALSFRDIE